MFLKKNDHSGLSKWQCVHDNLQWIKHEKVTLSCFDKNMFDKLVEVFQKNYLKLNESVCLAIIGPESETEAESRFYREIGSDLVNYSFAPEVITAVHCGIKYAAIGLITRHIIADLMMTDERSEEKKI